MELALVVLIGGLIVSALVAAAGEADKKQRIAEAAAQALANLKPFHDRGGKILEFQQEEELKRIARLKAPLEMWICNNCGFTSPLSEDCNWCGFPKPKDPVVTHLSTLDFRQQAELPQPKRYVPRIAEGPPSSTDKDIDPQAQARKTIRDVLNNVTGKTRDGQPPPEEDPLKTLKKREEGEDDDWWRRAID